MVADGALRNLAFVVRELQVHAATMNVELFAQVLRAHGRALDMPAGKAFTPWAFPAHDMFGWRRFPECEVGAVAFFFLTFQVAGGSKQVFNHTAAELSVIMS